MESKDEANSSNVLSRASVYATLKSYDVVPKEATQQYSKSLSNDGLVQLYHTASTNFHRIAETLDGKNTAGRPLTVADISGRIQQRALTLTGGGYNVAVHNKKQNKKETKLMSRASRKRARESLTSRVGGFSSTEANARFLSDLNAQWNAYATRVLLPPPPLQGPTSASNKTKPNDLSKISVRARQLADTMEWVGARVRVEACTAKLSTKGQQGILISQTARTYQIAPLQTGLERSSRGDDTNALKATLTLSKQGTVLAVLLPLEEDGELPQANEDRKDSAQNLCIILQDKVTL